MRKSNKILTGDLVFTRFIRRGGKIIWHPTGGVFVFPAYARKPKVKK